MNEQKDNAQNNSGARDRSDGKPDRVGGKNSAYASGGFFVFKNLTYEIKSVLLANRDKGATKDKKVGYETQEKRTTVVHGFFSDLFKLGYKITELKNLKEKHFVAVFNHLEEQGQSPSTIQNKISIMRLFCNWIGKKGMVRDSARYVKDKASVKRSTVVREDKFWDGNGIPFLEKLAEVAMEDKVVALRLVMFGIRFKA